MAHGEPDPLEFEVVELGPARASTPPEPPGRRRRRPRWEIAALLAIALAVGLYVAIDQDSSSRSAGPTPTPAPAPTSAPRSSARATEAEVVFGGAQQCASLNGHSLIVGLPLQGDPTTAITLDRLDVDLPLGGLRLIDSGRGGQCTATGGPLPGTALQPRAQVWIWVRFTALASCVAPLPIELRLTYTAAGRKRVTNGGFPDLGLLADSCPSGS